MNCKPGDLALIINATSQKRHIGKIVRVLERHERVDGRWIAWKDENLRPIRDNDGEDETLTWAGKPVEKETV